jgi:hypothetical protein
MAGIPIECMRNGVQFTSLMVTWSICRAYCITNGCHQGFRGDILDFASTDVKPMTRPYQCDVRFWGRLKDTESK